MQENDTNSTNVVLDALENVKNNVKENVKTVKNTVGTFTSEANIKQIKASVRKLVQDAQKDFSKLVDKDVAAAKKKFNAEKVLLDKEVKKQTLAAKKFIATQKKEVAALQARLEKLVGTTKKNVKAAPVKKATAKKVVKKATKKVTKKR
jgi:hypothetical protein